MLLLAVGLISSVQAGTITVAAGEVAIISNGVCSLLEALQNAQQGNPYPDCAVGDPAGPDNLVLAAGSLYTLTEIVDTTDGANGLPSITSALTVNGRGATIVRNTTAGAPRFRLFHVAATGNLTLNQVTLRGGSATVASGYGMNGGSLFNWGTVTLTNGTISGNTADTGGGLDNRGTAILTNSTLVGNVAISYGGGFHNTGGAGGTVTLTNSTVAGNVAGTIGGGLYNSGAANLTNSTFSGNVAGYDGGGLANGGIITLTNSTVAGNVAGASGGGLSTWWGTATLTNTIIAYSGGDNCLGSITTNRNNLFDDASCDGMATANINLDPVLKDNGCPTRTHALLAGSAAINAGDVTTCTNNVLLDFDQRGFLRDTHCDIGAYEFAAINPDKIGVQWGNRWYLDVNGNGVWESSLDRTFTFGLASDQPVAGDWDGDGMTEIGVKRNRQWYLDNGNGVWDGCSTFPSKDRCISAFGWSTDRPVAGDWDGDGITEIGVKRGNDWYLDRNANGSWDGCGVDQCIRNWGLPHAVPVSGRWQP
jgi:hypothetical protein